MFEGRAAMVPLLPGQALSGAKAIATRTLPLYTLDHMAALLLRVHFLRAVGTGGAQGHVPPQYFEQLVVVPFQYF